MCMLSVRPIRIQVRYCCFQIVTKSLAFLVIGHFGTAVMSRKNHLHRELTDIVVRLKIELRLSLMDQNKKKSLTCPKTEVCNYSKHLTEVLISITTIIPIL